MMSTAKAEAKNKLRKMKPWVCRFARFGYVSKGTVYAMVGILAALAAFGPSGDTTGTSGALQSIAELPFGEVALWTIGIGLIGYILWEFIKAIKDPDNDGTDAKGWIKRTSHIVSGIIYSNLAFGAIKLASHTGNAGGGNTEKTISAKLMEQPFGVWLVGIVGAIIIAYGAHEIYNGVKEKFMAKFKSYKMNEHEQKIARLSGKIGLISRGIVLGMIGFFFIRTAYTLDPNESKGLGGALTELASQPYGQFLLAMAAVGLMLYGVFQIIRGFYMRVAY